MNLSEFCQLFQSLDFPVATSRARPPRERVRTIQRAVEEAIVDDEFVADCIARDLGRLEVVPTSGLTPFHVIDRLGISLALAYWAPGQMASAHEHSDWTVTAVVHNALEVATFDRELVCKEGRLVRKNLFDAPAGLAGHIYDPCVHEPRNPTSRWSVSFHVLSPHDGELAPDGCRPILPEGELLADAHPAKRFVAFRHGQRSLRTIAELLATTSDPRGPALLEGVFARGNARTRRVAVEALAERDPAAAPRLRAAGERLALTPSTRLRTEGFVPPLEVRVSDGHADLVTELPLGPLVLLRVDDWAAEAVRVLASERELVVGELPGLDGGEQAALLEVVQEWGLFTTIDSQNEVFHDA